VGQALPKKFLESKELDKHDQLTEVDRAPGNNTFGMVGWVFTLGTPEYPEGRRVVVIANDNTFKIGSFGLLRTSSSISLRSTLEILACLESISPPILVLALA
jgi:hypothetical protein